MQSNLLLLHQDTLLTFGLTQLYSHQIGIVYASCKTLKGTIDVRYKWLDRNCCHIAPHSYDDNPAEIDENGTQKWYKDGKLHRGGDRPALITANGTQEWFKDGELHRDGDLPAVIYGRGFQFWMKNGGYDQDEDLPIDSVGAQHWYKNGKLHRDGDRPAVIFTDGTQLWYRNGKRYFP